MNIGTKLCFLMGLMMAASVVEAQTCNSAMQPSTPIGQFTVHGDGTLTDKRTKLRWIQCSLGQIWTGSACSGTATDHNWVQALIQAQNTSFAGFDDWRLPNLKELASIVEEACFSPAINIVLFPNTISPSVYWSSSPVSDTLEIWAIGLSSGGDFNAEKSSPYSVRLVRGGP